MWERRIAILATFAFIYNGESTDALALAKILLGDTHDLMHKAVGWMLREVGKRCSREALTKFIDKNISQMPRTTLRYSIEHFSPKERKEFLSR